MNKDYHVKGSHDYRARIFSEIEPEISAIASKEEAATVILDNIRKTGQMEGGGMYRIKRKGLDDYLKLYEAAAQLASKWHIFPEVIYGYAYRLQLLGMYSSSYRLRDILDNQDGLFKREMMGE